MMEQIVNRRAKRLSLRVVHRAGVIRLTVPPRATQFDIHRFVNSHRGWIEDKQKTLLPKIEIIDGSIIPFFGIDHTIRIEKHTKRATEINLSSSLHGLSVQSSSNTEIDYTPAFAGAGTSNDTHHKIIITTSRDDPTTNLKRWLIDRAREYIEPLSHEKAKNIRKKIKKIDLRDTASRWGSCSSDKRLMFSWRLIMAPAYVLDYVVAHEVAHLKRMDHSKKFWEICYRLSERPDDARYWLKHNGNALMRYF